MLAMSPFCPTTLGWDIDYPIELETNHNFENLDFDSIFLAANNIDSSSNKTKDYYKENQDEYKQDDVKQRSESPQGTTSSTYDEYDNSNPVIAKKLNHNASERDRRKKINSMYSSLRALLPASDHRKKLSIPNTVARVLEYIPELQKEVEGLNHKKEAFLSKIAALHGDADAGRFPFIQEEKPRINGLIKETTSCSISVNKLGDKEVVIQISTFERTSMADVLLLLENNAFLVIDVSSFQSFGGTTFYNLHLWMEGSYNVDYEKLNTMLMSLLQKQKQKQMQIQMQKMYT